MNETKLRIKTNIRNETGSRKSFRFAVQQGIDKIKDLFVTASNERKREILLEDTFRFFLVQLSVKMTLTTVICQLIILIIFCYHTIWTYRYCKMQSYYSIMEKWRITITWNMGHDHSDKFPCSKLIKAIHGEWQLDNCDVWGCINFRCSNRNITAL